MLNVINGFYKPTSGTINFAGTDRNEMEPELAAKSGIARTFQNIALFKGMSTLDNLMTGRLLKQKTKFSNASTLSWSSGKRRRRTSRKS